MTGEARLQVLLKSLAPSIEDEEYVFCTFAGAVYGDHAELAPVAAFREREGLTLVCPRFLADSAGIGYDSVFKMISLNVHSSLDAVGLTAAVAAVLARQGISANMIAGYYHDHIFVQQASAGQALEALNTLAVE